MTIVLYILTTAIAVGLTIFVAISDVGSGIEMALRHIYHQLRLLLVM